MNYKDVLIKLASMTIPYVYDDEVSFLELDRKLYKIVHELIVAMQGLNTDYEEFKTDMTNSFNSFTATINNNFDEFKSDVNNQISTFEENMNTNFNNFKTEIENNFNTLEGEFNTLKTYVDNYFSNLNLDEEVGAVIQKMYSDGTLGDIINEQIFNELNTKIDNLEEQVENIITNCGTGGLEQSGAFYYVYSTAFGVPVDKQLFTIQMPELPASDNNVYFYNKNQNSGYTGWKLNNVKASDVSNSLLLVQASVVDNVLSFNIIAGKNVKAIANLEEYWDPFPIINSTIGQVSNKYISSKYIGYNQYKLSGFFSITNSASTGSGDITIKPYLSPSPVGTPTTDLFVLKFYQGTISIEPMFFNWTGEAFVLNSGQITQSESAYYFIVPQVIKFE